MQFSERIFEAKMKEIIKLMKIESFKDLYAIVSKFKPKVKSGGKQREHPKKKSTDQGKSEEGTKVDLLKNKDSEKNREKQSVEDSDASIKLSNTYWIRGHSGAMIPEFLSAFCSAHEIDLFSINPEFIYENWSNILTLLPNELNKILIAPISEKVEKEIKKEEIREKVSEKEKKKDTVQTAGNNETSEKSKQNNVKAKAEKVFDMEDLIKEPENEENDLSKAQHEENSPSEHQKTEEHELETQRPEEVPIEDYKILYFDFNDFMDYFSQNKDFEKQEYIRMKKFLQTLSSHPGYSEKTLLLINNDGNYYANLFNDLFDYELTVPLPSESDRKQIFDVFKDSNLKYAYEATILASATHLWSLWDIKKLVTNAIHRFSLGLCRYDTINSDYMLSIINNEKILPKKSIKLRGLKIGEGTMESKETNVYSSSDATTYSEIKSSISDSLADQLYQEAAYKEFDNLSKIIQDMIATKPLNQEDYKIISNYAFILNDDPKKALSKLNQAKTRVDRIRKLKDK